MMLHKPDGLGKKRELVIFIIDDEKSQGNCSKLGGLFDEFILPSFIKASCFLAAWGQSMIDLAILLQL
jgi:hypothetical protein